MKALFFSLAIFGASSGLNVAAQSCMTPTTPFVTNRTELGVTVSWTTECAPESVYFAYALSAYSGEQLVWIQSGTLGPNARSYSTTLGSLSIKPNTRLQVTITELNSNTSTTTVVATLAAPPAAASPTFDLRSSDGFRIAWFHGGTFPLFNQPETQFQTQLSTQADFSTLVADSILSFNSPVESLRQWIASCLTADTLYYARVRAINSDGIPTAYVPLGSTTTLPTSEPKNHYSWTPGQWETDIAPGVLSQTQTLMFSSNPLQEPLKYADNASQIRSANIKLAGLGDRSLLPLVPNGLVEIAAYDGCSAVWADEIPTPARLTFEYPVGPEGVPLGNGFARPNTLRLFRLEPSGGLWIKIPTSVVDETAQTVSALVTQWGVFAVIGGPDESLRDVYAYPNPYHRSRATGITFANLSTQATIRLFTPSGSLVRSLEEEDGDGILRWDVTNSDGEQLAPGVYVMEIQSPSETRRDKLAILP